MAADLWDLMTQLHPPGASTQYVSPGGSSGNPGTSGSRTNLATAMTRIAAAGGGVIVLGDGDYGTISWVEDFSANSWGIIKAENRFGATAYTVRLGGSYIGIWGVSTNDSGADFGISCYAGHHFAIWCCWVGGHGGGGMGCPGNFARTNNFSCCYNIAERTCAVFFGSGISFFETSPNVGQVDHDWIAGYDNVIVGNICIDNYSEPWADGGQSDANGIILDDNWNLQSYANDKADGGEQGVKYTGNWLLLGNLCVANGGAGLHNLSTDNVDYYFNTVANNGRHDGGARADAGWEGSGRGMDAVCGQYGGRVSNFNVYGNLVRENATESWGWFERSTAVAPFNYDDNVVLYGNQSFTNETSRRADGWGYLTANPPTLLPRLDTAAQWLPDGGASGVIEKMTPSTDLRARLEIFPDLLGVWRPAGAWTIGALETEGGNPGSNAPVAAFSWAPSSPIAGQQVQFTDESSYTPTSWEWDFGDDAAGFPLPEAGLNGAGHFSGRILFDGNPYANVTVKVVDAYHPNWPVGDVLDTLGGHDGQYVWVTNTDADGFWSVTGLNVGRSYMLKVFPPDRCAAFGEIAAGYVTAETGYINPDGDNFQSTRSAPSGQTYHVYSHGRFLFDMPVHVHPTVSGALNGNQGYSDLNIEFFTRTGSFPTSAGTQSGCVAQPPAGGGTGSTAQNPTKTYDTPGTYTVTLEATNAQGSSTKQSAVTVTSQPAGGGGTFQAEDAAITSGYPGDIYALHTTTESPGYTGSGYVGYWGQTGEKLTWTISAPNGAGAYTATFRFHTPEGGTRTLWVNGAQVGTITFPANAGSWGDGTWGNSSPVTINLNSGTNTIELRHAGETYTGYIDLDSMTLSGGGTNATVTLGAFARSAVVPGVSVSTETIVGATVSPLSISAPVRVPSIVHQRTATTAVGVIAAPAGIDAPDSVGQLVVIDVTVEAEAIVARGALPIGDIEAKRMLAGRYLLMGGTKQRIQG